MLKGAPWRQKVEEKLGSVGIEELERLNHEWRNLDIYQIQQSFLKLSLAALCACLDDLNWLGLHLTSEGTAWVAFNEKLEEFYRHLEELKGLGYFSDFEPKRFATLRQKLGEEKAKEMFTP